MERVRNRLPIDILPALLLRSSLREKNGDSYGTRLLAQRRRFGGFLLLTALPHRSLHRLSGPCPAL
jgi:hypothetical protein